MLVTRNPWSLPVLWALFILILCGIPGSRIPEIDFWKWLRWDKLTHFVLFSTQCILLLRADHRHRGVLPDNMRIWRWTTLTILYGSVVEILQMTVFVGRSADIKDAIANGLGAIIGVFIFKKFNPNKA